MNESQRALEEQFDRIVAEYGPSISRLVFSYESIAGVREELVQEIAMAIWKALPHFRGQCSERTFVFRIAHNRGLSHASRRRPAHEPLGDLADAEVPTDPQPDPEQRAMHTDERARLASAIQNLPLAQRQITVLMLEGLSHAEMAEVLGTTENNVGVRLTRAKTALKKALGGKQ